MKIIDKLKKHLASLEFEVRRETGSDRDDTANQRDAVARKLDAMDCDGLDPDGKETRGFICDECGEVIGSDPDERHDHG